MAISEEDLRRIDEHLDGKFVKVEHCDSQHKDTDSRIVSLTVAYTETKTQFRMLMGILSVIGTAVIGILVKMLIGG